LVVRERDPDDRRVMNVRLTPVGARVRDSATVLDPELVDAMLRRMPPGDRRLAVRGVTLLAEAADELLSDRDVSPGPLTGGVKWR
jgi:DNA-binding MarR family transcriptional regulator